MKLRTALSFLLVAVLLQFGSVASATPESRVFVPDEYQDMISADILASLGMNSDSAVTKIEIVSVQFSDSENVYRDYVHYDDESLVLKDEFMDSIAKGEIPSKNREWQGGISLLVEPGLSDASTSELISGLQFSSSTLPLLLGPPEEGAANSIEYRARFLSRSGTITEYGHRYAFLEPYMCIVYAIHSVVTR